MIFPTNKKYIFLKAEVVSSVYDILGINDFNRLLGLIYKLLNHLTTLDVSGITYTKF